MKKKVIVVVSILVIIGAAVAAGLWFNEKQDEKSTAKKEQVVTDAVPDMKVFYHQENIGKIKGYTMKMRHEVTRDVVIPVSTQRRVPIQITANDNKIKKISYQVNEPKQEKLIDSGEITGWKQEKGKISLNYEASAIMTVGTEYLFQLTLETDKHSEVYYYARIMAVGEDFITKQIAFAKDFSDRTFVESKSQDLANYLEPDSRYASDNLGQTTLRSTYGMLIWKTFHPEKTVKTEISTKDFCIKDSGEAGTYTMTYQIKATNAQKVEELYHVSETITVWTYSGKQYVLAYDREVNQIWEANENNVGSAFIDFGIQKQTDIAHVESGNQQYIAYAINGDVYVMDLTEKRITPAYQSTQIDSEQLYRTRTKVIKVDNKGNLEYMIYGYSPSEEHVGKSGISIMEYNYEKNSSTERVFIPMNVPAQVLEKQLSELYYVGDGTVYIMIDNTIYYVNLKTMEWGNLAGPMEEGTCAVNASATKIAYNTERSKRNSNSITIVDLTNGTKKLIKAEKGMKISVCGYTGENLAYALAEETQLNHYSFFPISELKIVDAQEKEIKTYAKNHIVLSDVKITDTVISFRRWKKGKEISGDQLLDNTKNREAVATSSYYKDDIKMQELALSFTNNLDSKLELSVRQKGEVRFDAKLEVETKMPENRNQQFLAYGYGKLQGIYGNKDEAIKQARENYGLVTDEKGAKIWVFEEHYK